MPAIPAKYHFIKIGPRGVAGHHFIVSGLAIFNGKLILFYKGYKQKMMNYDCFTVNGSLKLLFTVWSPC
jgi:hypothetical protein